MRRLGFGFGIPSMGRRAELIAALFASGAQGVWLDPSDLSTLYQDIDGFLPANTAGQQVALMRDKSGRGNHFVQPTALSRPALQTDGLGRWYLDFDGVDDFMSTIGTLDLSASDKMTAWAGFRFLGAPNGYGFLFETSPSALAVDYPGSANFAAPSGGSGGASRAGYSLRGSSSLGAVVAPASLDTNIVTSCAFNIAGSGIVDEMRARFDGSSSGVYSAGSPAGGGNFGNHRAYLGMRAGSAFPFRGRLYGLVMISGATDASTISAIEGFLGPKTGLAAPTISVSAGSGYAGSVLQASKPGGYWLADGVASPGATEQSLTVTLDLEGAEIAYKLLGVVSAPFRMWTPKQLPEVVGLFDIRKVAADATAWNAAAGSMRYTQPDEAARPAYEATGLAGGPCMFSDWNRNWRIEGMSPAPAARTFIGLFAFIGSDPANWLTIVGNDAPGAWGLVKSYSSGGKRVLGLNRTPSLADLYTSGWVIEDGAPCLISAKTSRPVGEYGFRHNGLTINAGTSPSPAFEDNGGEYSMGGYIRLGSHAYIDACLSPEDEAKFEGWCAWTSDAVSLLDDGHPYKAAAPRVS